LPVIRIRGLSTSRKPRRHALCTPAIALAVLALAASGCGKQTSASGSAQSTSRVALPLHGNDQATRAGAKGGGCGAQLGGLLRSMDTLRTRLAIGLTYESYLHRVNGLRATYDEVPVGRLSLNCLSTGAPAERALNEYIAAANLWGDCLATPGCDTGNVEPKLQRHWKIASRYLSRAQRSLGDKRA
jgi:hypothetical protein